MTLVMLQTSAIVFAVAVNAAAQTQAITLPPNGDNQRSEVIQQIGLVRASIEYSSPDVHAPNGDDRRGKIWGALVPYGIHDLGFNNRKGPWRAGANENTVFTVSHPVKINGQPLAAGRYGLHMLASDKEWTVIFSKNSTSWGSFTYDAAEDVLRVTVKPEKSPYREWLSYDFIDRKSDRATVALQWEELSVPFTIAVDDMPTLYIDNMRRELRDFAGFRSREWLAAAQVLSAGRTQPRRSAEVGGQLAVASRRRAADVRRDVHESADSREALASDRCRRGHVGGARPAQCAPGRDSSVRADTLDARQGEGRDGGVPEERAALRRRLADARGPRARLLRDG